MLARQRLLPASSSSPGPASSSAVRYEVDAFDVHVINHDYRFAAPPAVLVPDPSKPAHGAGVRIMMALTVAGTVHLGSTSGAENARTQHFSDVFILVPNWDAIAKHGSRNTRRYIIASHTYRAY